MLVNRYTTLLREVCTLYCCRASDLVGQSIGDILADLDREPGMNVFWGAWSSDELDRVVRHNRQHPLRLNEWGRPVAY